MKRIIYSSFLVVALILASCSDFGDLNVDPNNTTNVSSASLLTSSLRSISDIAGRVTEVLYAQYMSDTQYSEESRYDDINFDFNGWYTGPLANLQQIIAVNTDPATAIDQLPSGSNNNQIAVARILRAYFFQFMTDRWGPLPYTQALQGRENFTPTYDSQSAIYADLMKELKEAVAQIDGGDPVKGDFILNGDMDMWKVFGNTLRMNMALRMSKVDPGTAQSEFNSAAGAGVISSHDQSIMYPYLAESNNQNPWFGRFITRTDYAISNTLVDYMKPLGDMRLFQYADDAPNHGEIRGMPYGIAAAGDIPNADISFPHITAVRGQDAPIAIFSYSQILFNRAEAAHLGWGGDAESLYRSAIQASWQQWGVFDQTAFDAFMDQDGVKWDASRGDELIGTQKWVALYLQGVEAWCNWRRTGWPALAPAPDPLNASGQIPVRQGYPTSERDINSASYDGGVSILDGESSSPAGDGLDTKLWWDK